MLTNLLFFVALFSLNACCAEEAADAMLLTRMKGPVELLRREKMRWRAAWNARNFGDVVSVDEHLAEWEDLGEVHINAPLGERVVSVSMSRHFASLMCEESRRSVGGFLRGRCTLQPSPAVSQSEVFFTYRVTHKATEEGVTVNAPEASHTCKLYEENTREFSELEIGTATYGEREKAVEGHGLAIFIRLLPTRSAQDHVGWLPCTLRLTGVSMDVVERGRWKRRAASTIFERWGYPLLAVLALYGGLLLWDKIATRHSPPAAKPKHD
ncbi:hypothetical protein TcG_05555 [Trypanosoma cruzi]|uniref:Uncharacterized protein n=1 Tax=Trypanosoma cruzi Dm28c TaxID=1416333 RepID=V5DB19_TRYCR|nr:hypothetical protein TCDM_07219 [Trypanosoma cruzi Dm28c]PBJ78186.1 hypothetical protein BCY84_05055 [Trypanosoma cruzi cruzi]RNF17403.1 hypothetical protein TcG_05555 [Trypanosoma cruzi]